MKRCHECNQECCKSVIVEIDEPETKEDWEDIMWQVAHKNVQVMLDNEDDWCIEFLTDCEEMDEKGLCKIYKERPQMCRNHEPETCIVNGEGDYYKLIFRSINDVKKYLKEHPEAIKEETTELHTCPKCGFEFTDEDEEINEEE